jgi:hypothetical protein
MVLAIILQELYNHYRSDVIKKDVAMWRQDCLGYIPDATIKRVMTTLRNSGKIRVDDESVYLKETDGRPKEEEEPKEKKPREEQPHWTIAVKLVEWCESDPALVSPTKYVKLAVKLHRQGYTLEYLEKRYGPGGLWYTHEFKGQKGNRPNHADITRTIRKPYDKIRQSTEEDKSKEFFR